MASTEGLRNQGCNAKLSYPQNHGKVQSFVPHVLLATEPPLDFTNYPGYDFYQDPDLRPESDQSDIENDSGSESYDIDVEDAGCEDLERCHYEHEPESDLFLNFDLPSPTLASTATGETGAPGPLEELDPSRLLQPSYQLPKARWNSPLRSNFVSLKELRGPLPMSNFDWGTQSEPRGSRRDRRRRSTKAQLQILRDRASRSRSIPLYESTAATAAFLPAGSFEEHGPKRKHCAFVQEQELKCLIEDRVGTPHLSELQPGDDVNGQLNVDELGVGGEVAAFSTTQGPSIFEVTDIPDEGRKLS